MNYQSRPVLGSLGLEAGYQKERVLELMVLPEAVAGYIPQQQPL